MSEDYREPAWLRLHIVSDGTSAGTMVLDAETGRPLFGVVRVSWEAGWDTTDRQPRVRLELEQVALNITGEGAITRLPDYPHRLATEGPPHAG